MKQFENTYDVEGDSFYINDKTKTEKVFGSHPIGPLVIDITVSGEVKGIEIDNASTVFNVAPMELKKIEPSSIRVGRMGRDLAIGFTILLANKMRIQHKAYVNYRNSPALLPAQ